MRSLILIGFVAAVGVGAPAQGSPVALRGDVNRDGKVDAADLAAVRRHLGQPVTAGNARYDVNRSGTLNALDLLAVRSAIGTSAPPARAASGETDQVSPPPEVVAIAPDSGRPGDLVFATITGRNFDAGATARLEKSALTIEAGDLLVDPAGTWLTCTLDLTEAELGQWDVVVTNSDAQEGRLVEGFTVNPPLATTFDVRTLADDQPTAWVAAGTTIELAVRIQTNDTVGGVALDVELPREGWTLAYHELSDHGWCEYPEVWDASVPQDPTAPVIINNGVYLGPDPAGPVPDFHIGTAHSNAIHGVPPAGVTGAVTVVSFGLEIPFGTPDGIYPIALRNVEAGDVDGTVLGNVTAGPDLDLQVASVPLLSWTGEPGFSEDGCDPDVGEGGVTLFRFRAKLTDVDGDEPDLVQLLLRCDGTLSDRYRLRRESGSLETGRIYSVQLQDPLPPGRYEYRFRARDADGFAIGPPTEWRSGPCMSAELFFLPASGLEDGLRPNTGTADDTKFLWAVGYREFDGDWPEYVRVVLWRDGARYRTMRMALAGPRRDLGSGVVYACRRRLPAGDYKYRFVATDKDGRAIGPATSRMPGPLVTDGGSSVAIASLTAAPTRAGVQVTVALTAGASVQVRVLNIAGRPVGVICRDRRLAAGSHALIWNAKAANGLPAPSGTYLVEITARAADGSQACGLTRVRVNR